jgi:small subunit ribosomal protein S20
VANHPSAEKRARQNLKRRDRNRHVKTTVRSFVKKVREAVASGDKKVAQAALVAATKRIDQAVGKGVFHRRTGSRYIARIAAQVSGIKG